MMRVINKIMLLALLTSCASAVQKETSIRPVNGVSLNSIKLLNTENEFSENVAVDEFSEVLDSNVSIISNAIKGCETGRIIIVTISVDSLGQKAFSIEKDGDCKKQDDLIRKQIANVDFRSKANMLMYQLVLNAN